MLQHLRSLCRLLGMAAILGLLAVPVGMGPWAQEKPKAEPKADAAKQAATSGSLPEEWVKPLTWREIGPAGMGGRITGISVYEADPSTYYVATASGGLLKTTNAGTTFQHQFDKESTVSIGDVCVAPSNPDIVWVGTGEANPRNSVSYGDGVYKSVDGGKSWKNMGLKKTFQIGKIVIHPKNPQIVYVGALGRLYGPNEERGLYKTTNGGESWERVLFIDDKTGIMDIAMHPTEPDTLLVAAWERLRDGFDSHPGNEPMEDGYDGYDPIKKWGPGSGIYKTKDGGKKWDKITKGLPACPLGRMGLDYYRKNPNHVYLILDCQKVGMGKAPTTADLGFNPDDAEAGAGARVTFLTPNSVAAKTGLKADDVIEQADKQPIKDGLDLLDLMSEKKPGDEITLSVIRKKAKDSKETEKLTIAYKLTTRQQGGGFGGGGGPGGGGFGGQPRVYLGLAGERTETGYLVTQVTPDSPAAKSGLKEDDVIQTMDKQEVFTVQEVFAALRGKNPGDKMALVVLRDKKKIDVELTLERRPGLKPGKPGENTRPNGANLGGQRANAQNQQGPNGYEYGGVYKSTDGGESWTRINSVNPRPMYFSVIRVDPSDENHLFLCGVAMFKSSNNGRTFTPNASNRVHADQHALWINPRDGRHMIVGCDGGFYVSHDRTATWDHLCNVAIAQFYHVAVDSRRLYRAYGGLQDNGSWAGPTQTLTGPGPITEDWFNIGGGDGFMCRVDATDADLVYSTSQDGRMSRRHLKTGESAQISPRRADGQPPHRFNWNTPFILSSHNPKIFYCGGEYVFRSFNRGDNLKIISPEITRTKRGSATALAESPRNPDILYVGTDDGALWVTRDGGGKWTSIAENVPLPGPRWVATIEPSRERDGRCYVTFDAHRSDDDEPYVFVTEDYGKNWKSLRGNLPTGSTRVLREDIVNPNVLYLGTEFAAWVSVDKGNTWTKLNNNLPTVAVHEFAQHPTAGEMVAATHGRSLWVLDVTPLRQITADTLKAKAHLYRPNTVVRWRSEPQRLTGGGHKKFYGDNPPRGAQIFYSLKEKADKVQLKIVDFEGQTVREMLVSSDPGFHKVTWDLGAAQRRGGGGEKPGKPDPAKPDPDKPEKPEKPEQPEKPGGKPGFGGGGRFGGGGFGGASARPGMYRVVLNVDGKDYTQALRIEADPTAPSGTITNEEEEDKEKDRE